MGSLRIGLPLLIWMSVITVSWADVQLKVIPKIGSVRMVSSNLILDLGRSRPLERGSRVVAEDEGQYDLRAEGLLIRCSEGAALHFSNDGQLQLVIGTFMVALNENLKLRVPQGDVVLKPGVHSFELNDVQLRLQTLEGKPATLSTSDMVRRTRLGYTLVSDWTGRIAHVKTKLKPKMSGDMGTQR